MAAFRQRRKSASSLPSSAHQLLIVSPCGQFPPDHFLQFLPEDKKADVQADYDSIRATVQGFEIGVKVKERTPYSKIEFVDDGAPFHFTLTMHFDPSADPYKTDFQIVVDADLNFMMKALLGSKLKEALDKVVDSLVAVSEGRMPEGFDPSMYPQGFGK